MLTIYHNPRCSKSRASLQVLQDSGTEFQVKKYLDEGLNQEEIESILKKLDMPMIDILRVKESEFKANGLSKTSSQESLLSALLEMPKLLERPIVVDENSGVIGRPVENTIEFLSSLK
ncbi:arsenate reductase (glutaredoxin) [bacterium]|nr:arsenate reductase (glutaredoxin) [bacterium]